MKNVTISILLYLIIVHVQTYSNNDNHQPLFKPHLVCDPSFFDEVYEQTLSNKKSIQSIVTNFLMFYELQPDCIQKIKEDLEEIKTILPEYILLHVLSLKEIKQCVKQLESPPSSQELKKIEHQVTTMPEFTELERFKKNLYIIYERWNKSIHLFIAYFNYIDPLTLFFNNISQADFSTITQENYMLEPLLHRQLSAFHEIIIQAIDDYTQTHAFADNASFK